MAVAKVLSPDLQELRVGANLMFSGSLFQITKWCFSMFSFDRAIIFIHHQILLVIHPVFRTTSWSRRSHLQGLKGDISPRKKRKTKKQMAGNRKNCIVRHENTIVVVQSKDSKRQTGQSYSDLSSQVNMILNITQGPAVD